MGIRTEIGSQDFGVGNMMRPDLKQRLRGMRRTAYSFGLLDDSSSWGAYFRRVPQL